MCHLPITSGDEEKAVKRVIGYIRSLRQKSFGDIQGFTYSDLYPAVFHGYWWDSDDEEWLDEGVSLFIIDYKIASDSRVSISEKIAELKRKIAEAYEHYGSSQDMVWVVAHPIVREE